MKTDKEDSASLNVSSNVLFHFTNSLANLFNILKSDFSPRYCAEYSPYELIPDPSKDTPPRFARPMVCFCDLPLFLIKKHLNRYGPYGIGLTKRWGMEKGVTPVMYVHERSETLKPIEKVAALQGLIGGMNSSHDPLKLSAEWLMAYVKPYEGPAWRKGKFEKSVRFYDEREWRFTPGFLGIGDVKHSIPLSSTSEIEDADRAMDFMISLSFTPADIEYIILENSEEILPFIPKLVEIKSKFGEDQVKLVTTKITTAERIREDN